MSFLSIVSTYICFIIRAHSAKTVNVPEFDKQISLFLKSPCIQCKLLTCVVYSVWVWHKSPHVHVAQFWNGCEDNPDEFHVMSCLCMYMWYLFINSTTYTHVYIHVYAP